MSMRTLRRAAYRRQRGLCAATGLSLGDIDDGPWDLHHRLAGNMGGTIRDRDVLSNLICVLSPAHNLGSPRLAVAGRFGRSIHGDPRWARANGLLLSSGGDPAAEPVLMARWGWVFLTDEGDWLPVIV